MSKEELIQKEIARILIENPENPVAALRAKRKQALISTPVKEEAQKPIKQLTNVI